MPTRIIVQSGDQHAGSTLGLLPPSGVRHDDGQLILPSDPQLQLWEWYRQFGEDVNAIIAHEKKRARRKKEDRPTVHGVLSGDLTDADHHGTQQILGRDSGIFIDVGIELLEQGLLRWVKFDTIHFLRGTPSHTGGESAGFEKAIARRIQLDGYPVVKDEENDTLVWRELEADFNGQRVSVKHHGRTGQRSNTRRSYQGLYSFDVWASYITDGKKPPAIALRGHKHQFNDSGPDHRGTTRVIACPCWQFSSAWVKSRSIESEPDYGGVVVVIREDVRVPHDIIVKPLLYKPTEEQREETVWRP